MQWVLHLSDSQHSLALIPLVKTGYSYIGYATLIVIVIPFIVHMIVGCVKNSRSWAAKQLKIKN